MKQRKYKKIASKYPIEKWVFPGQRKGNHLSKRSVQSLMQRSVKKVVIKKKASVHTLRHSFEGYTESP